MQATILTKGALPKQTIWVEGDFTDFLREIPRKHLLNQIYMFENFFDRRLALKKLSEVSAVGFLDNYEGIIARINSEFSLNLQATNIGRGNKNIGISNTERSMLEAALEEEYRPLEEVRREFG